MTKDAFKRLNPAIFSGTKLWLIAGASPITARALINERSKLDLTNHVALAYDASTAQRALIERAIDQVWGPVKSIDLRFEMPDIFASDEMFMRSTKIKKTKKSFKKRSALDQLLQSNEAKKGFR